MTLVRLCREDDIATVCDIINEAAAAYRGVIPADRWHDPYMSMTELQRELAAGVEFWCIEAEGGLLGVMGIQPVRDVDLIRHAYVRAQAQRRGIGGMLLEHLRRQSNRQILVGTWAAASWAIDFYQRHGFVLVRPPQATALLSTYWSIPARQVETSVVLASPPI
jgi:GNAT superfamily N-acetyltransferase